MEKTMNKYDDYLLKNSKFFMQYKKTIDKLENQNLTSVPATIGALRNLSPTDLLDNKFTVTEVEKMLYCLRQYGLTLTDYNEPVFDPDKLETM